MSPSYAGVADRDVDIPTATLDNHEDDGSPAVPSIEEHSAIGLPQFDIEHEDNCESNQTGFAQPDTATAPPTDDDNSWFPFKSKLEMMLYILINSKTHIMVTNPQSFKFNNLKHFSEVTWIYLNKGGY